MWRDIQRRVADYGIPFVDPESLASRVGWCPEYTKATYHAWFIEDKPPGDPAHLASILRALHKDPEAVISAANSQQIKDKYEAETDVARKLGIFGSQSVVVGKEIF
jgi:2-hydroxychromene-2-carboxylate isomerase